MASEILGKLPPYFETNRGETVTIFWQRWPLSLVRTKIPGLGLIVNRIGSIQLLCPFTLPPSFINDEFLSPIYLFSLCYSLTTVFYILAL